jgi:hypothetical protein
VEIPSSSHDELEEIYKAIDGFFETCLLSWIEVLSLTGNLNVGVYALNDVQQWYMLVSHVRSIYWNLCSQFFRQEFPASGHMTASNFS